MNLEKTSRAVEESKKLLDQSINEWADAYDISVRTREAIQRLNIATVRDLINHTETDLVEGGCYITNVMAIRGALAKSGLSFKAENK